jgi:hypothetical protein
VCRSCLCSVLLCLRGLYDCWVLLPCRTFLVDKLEFRKVRDTVAVHVPCSSKKMGIEESFTKLAGRSPGTWYPLLQGNAYHSTSKGNLITLAKAAQLF